MTKRPQRIVGFTGTRNGMTARQKHIFRRVVTERVEPIRFHHGDCVGADADAHDLIFEYTPAPITIHPPTNDKNRAWKGFPATSPRINVVAPDDYFVRDRHIVAHAQLVIATPAGFKRKPRSGTWYTLEYAIKQGRGVIVIFPDGSTKQYPWAHSRKR